MPIYTYHCEHCGHQFDKRQNFSDSALVVCPECHRHSLHKVYQPSGVVFKGSGFYVTDKRGKSTAAAGSPNGKPKPKTEGKPETKSDSSKSETKSSTTAKAD